MECFECDVYLSPDDIPRIFWILSRKRQAEQAMSRYELLFGLWILAGVTNFAYCIQNRHSILNTRTSCLAEFRQLLPQPSEQPRLPRSTCDSHDSDRPASPASTA